MEKRVRITVLNADVNEELKARYAVADLGPCPFHPKGQGLYTNGEHKPERKGSEAGSIDSIYAEYESDYLSRNP